LPLVNLKSGIEQVVFGRVEAAARPMAGSSDRQPSLAGGLFNHSGDRLQPIAAQALRSVPQHPRTHDRRLPVLRERDREWHVACKCIDEALAVIDVDGVSSGAQTLSQKLAIDFLVGRASRAKLLLVLGRSSDVSTREGAAETAALISVCVPTFNGAPYIAAQLASILRSPRVGRGAGFGRRLDRRHAGRPPRGRRRPSADCRRAASRD
jgi:hypothetical protein